MHACPTCQNPLPLGQIQGLCPHCLLKQGLGDEAGLTTLPTDPVESQSLPPLPGTRMEYFGEYVLLEEIARGGMGVVYKAKQASLNRVVALKMILRGQLASDAEIRRFQTEAAAAASLKHPHIVTIHEIGVHEGQHYFTMDYVEGTDLSKLLGGRPIAAERAARYVQTLAEAVHFAHARGILHRDLKPQNILVDSLDRLYVTDFGLAKQLADDSSLTQSGAVMGTPLYMPPEQARGRNDLVGPASDVYAIGAILYHALTGRPPVAGSATLDTLLKLIDAPPIPPETLNPNTPPDLSKICLKCLEKSPASRYPSALELAADLRRFLAHEPIHAKPTGILQKSLLSLRRNPSLIAGAAAMAIVALSISVFLLAEENSFLRALQSLPDLKRQLGLRSLQSLPGALGNGFLILSSVWISLFLHAERRSTRSLGTRLTRGLLAALLLLLTGLIFATAEMQNLMPNLSASPKPFSWIQATEISVTLTLAGLWFFSGCNLGRKKKATFHPFDPHRFLPLQGALGTPARITIFCVGLANALLSGFLLTSQIRASVWENAPLWLALLPLTGFFCSIWICSKAWSDYRLSETGIPVRELPPVAVEKMQDRLQQDDRESAMSLYRAFVPEANSFESWDYMASLKNWMQSQKAEAAAASPAVAWTFHRAFPVLVLWSHRVLCAFLLVAGGLVAFENATPFAPTTIRLFRAVNLILAVTGLFLAWQKHRRLSALLHSDSLLNTLLIELQLFQMLRR